ncbi:hypothetical protein DFH08DRAFT_265627 [Mycena albidolilacea]|uniref:Uncharacterized protein n=1 Tax=Mycena albidolilacea TaxID=1033008 RepID=A0AAD7ANT1_9AGAR|nr:hypothetical protein DFH08DRAFT_265627 [Mycena albidolilacea]
MVDISTPDKPLPTTAYSDCILFHRAVDAACAWTTAPINLLGTHIARCSIPLHVAVLGLPCCRPVEPAPIERLIKHWSATSHWSEETQNQATEHLRKFDDAGHDALQAPDAQCHSEAGLIASIVRLHPEPKVFPRVGLHRYPRLPALTTRHCAFKDSVADAEYAIGIPRKCCPVCRILAEIVNANYNLNLELPGRHNRYRPWVPPHWLPDAILEKLEAALQRRVTDMLAPPKRTSRDDFKFNMSTADIAELLMDLGDLDDIEV